MALTDSQKKKLKKLDIRNEGLVEDAAKAEANDRKTIIIGLGGMGGKIIARVKSELQRRVKYTGLQIRLLAIDSDENDLENREDDGLTNDETFQIFFGTADSILLRENTRPMFFRKWINLNYSQKLEGAGCGRVRQAGRALLLGNNYGDLINRLKVAIRDLAGNGILSQLNVHIVAGIAGGTGSGSFIDMPNIVRQAFNELGGVPAALKLNAYLLLPNVMFGVQGVNQTEGFAINGYAALKELDYYMGRSYRTGNTTLYDDVFEYPKGQPVILQHVNGLYDMCTLISGVVGGGIPANIDSYAIDVTAETILNLLIDTKSEEVKDGQMVKSDFQIIQSFLDNTKNDIEMLEARPPDDTVFARDAYYKYCATGVGTAVIPNDAIMAYVGAKVFESLIEGRFHKGEPVPVDKVRTFVSKALMSPNEMFDQYIHTSTEYAVNVKEDERPTFGDVNANSVRTFESILNQRKLSLAVLRQKLVDNAIGRAIEHFDAQIQIFLLESGPYQLKQVFEMRKEQDNRLTYEGVEQIISRYAAEMDAIIRNLETNRANNMDLLNKAKAEIEKPDFWTKVLTTFQRNRVNSYVQLRLKDANFELLIDAADLMKQSLHRLTDHIRAYMANCNKLTEVLDFISDILMQGKSRFERTDEMADESEQSKKTAPKAVMHKYSMNMLDPQIKQDMYNWAKANLDTFIASVDLNKIHQEIVEDFCADPKKWVATDHEFHAHEKIKGFFNKEFGGMVRITVRNYFDRMMQLEGVDSLRREIQFLCNTIKGYAEPMFAFIPNYPVRARKIAKSYLIVPDDLSDAVKGEFVAYALANNLQITFSNAAGQIAYYNIIAGLPLYAERFMRSYEATYAEGNRFCQHMNERLNDADNLSWQHYPPVISNTIWGSMEGNYVNKDENEFMVKVFKPLIEKAKSIGILYHPADGMPYSVRAIRADEKYARECANKYCTRHQSQNQVMPKGATLFEALYQQAADKMELPVTLLQKDSLNTARDEAEAYNNALIVLRKHVPLYLLLKDTVKLYLIAERIVDEIDQDNRFNETVGSFIKALATDVIFAENERWFVCTDYDPNQDLIDVRKKMYKENLMALNSGMKYYYVYDAYSKLQDHERSAIEEIANKRLDEDAYVVEFAKKRKIIIDAARKVLHDKTHGNNETALKFFTVCAAFTAE